MKLDIHDIDIADSRIIQMNLYADLRSVSIICENSFRISDKSRFGKTEININNWDELFVEKYVTTNAFEKGQTFQIDWTKEIETFELIQEIIFDKNENLYLNGYSKVTGAWLTYNFKNYNCIVEAEPIQNV